MSSRKHLHAPRGMGQRVTDTLTAFYGSWRCVWLHVAWFAGWFLLRLDVGLLTNIVSLEAIFACILLLMSQNRQSAIDRARDDHEAAEVDLEAQEVHYLARINRQQLVLLILWPLLALTLLFWRRRSARSH